MKDDGEVVEDPEETEEMEEMEMPQNDVEASEDDKETETKDEKDVGTREENKFEIIIPDTKHQTPGRA